MSNFVPNPAFPAYLRRSPEMGAFLLFVAEAVAEEAKSIAPVRTGDYRDGIEATVLETGAGFIGRVNANNFKSWWIEVGTGHPGPTPAFAPLGAALQSVTGF